MIRNRKIAASILAIAISLTAVGCSSDADVASENLSKAADNFEVNRRVVMMNTRHNTYLMQITGACSIKEDGKQLEVICKVGKGEYKKHFLHLGDGVTYFVEQGEPIKVSANHYRVTFRPQSIIPDPDFRGSTDDGPRSQN